MENMVHKSGKCEFCSGTDILGVEVDKAYRRGCSYYQRGDGEYWVADEFHFESDLPGILNAGSVNMKVCLDCHKIQGFSLTGEQKAQIIEGHIKHGDNPRERARKKEAERAARKAERESKEALYAEWRKGQPERPVKKDTAVWDDTYDSGMDTTGPGE
jgi:hypothetical protein